MWLQSLLHGIYSFIMLLSGKMSFVMFYRKMTSEKLLSQNCMTKIIDKK